MLNRVIAYLAHGELLPAIQGAVILWVLAYVTEHGIF
jgi:hypothetical protein